MVWLGLEDKQKAERISEYVKANDIQKVIVFSHEKCPFYLPDAINDVLFFAGRRYQGEEPSDRLESASGIQVDYYTWSDIIKYKCFYPLLEEIGGKHLIVCNELMRDLHRGCLTYNCLRHYQQQTSHFLTFSWLPIRNAREDFMILVDQSCPLTYKMSNIDDMPYSTLQNMVCGVVRTPSLDIVDVNVVASAEKEYEVKLKEMFDNLGQKNPDTVPRRMQLWCGKFKVTALRDGTMYYARNDRFKQKNIVSMTSNLCPTQEIWMLETPPSRAQFADFVRDTHVEKIHLLRTPLKVDMYYAKDTQEWLSEMEALYAKAGISAK